MSARALPDVAAILGPLLAGVAPAERPLLLAIAERMAASKRRIPHFTYVEEVDVTALEELRAQVNAGDRQRLSVLPFLMRAVVVAVRDHPEMNARYDDENGIVERHRQVQARLPPKRWQQPFRLLALDDAAYDLGN